MPGVFVAFALLIITLINGWHFDEIEKRIENLEEQVYGNP